MAKIFANPEMQKASVQQIGLEIEKHFEAAKNEE